jgi:hypothetical protein
VKFIGRTGIYFPANKYKHNILAGISEFKEVIHYLCLNLQNKAPLISAKFARSARERFAFLSTQSDARFARIVK